MSNTQTNNSKNVNQPGVAQNDKHEQQQKKGFDQGNGNNSTTADASRTENKNNPQQSSNNQGQSKITNQDDRITNKDGSMTNKSSRQNEINDDEDVDVDENSQLEGYKEEPEVDTPTRKTENTENKLPKMNK